MADVIGAFLDVWPAFNFSPFLSSIYAHLRLHIGDKNLNDISKLSLL